MRILCMFDLPSDTKEEKKRYRIFKKELLANGFVMLQYSVYYRIVPNRSAGKKFESILKRVTPPHGEIRLMYVSEKQFEDMQLLVGTKSHQEEKISNNRLVII
ncbi:CRISPR-associated endonuclease Cas2 [Enterococcus sp. CWB-B31]|uniref:CRISPR-associated endonuclease Cas2 n=1 Tax=Enterococcus sp. CWB-B31 TaxID=2885159 RepID=UPI001E59D151|nr:CRISPR-associated endonuclease Cas2 [Enterococcus sp. CWB-B31]MCB5955768.1 CRISPR-associated endonuclease Cas2 [Enterococcus sp. CWB-B31]